MSIIGHDKEESPMRTLMRFVLGLSAGLWSLGVGAQAVEYIHTDALGSVVAITDQSGVVVERNEYEPFGADLTSMKDGPGYTGHVADSATALNYMQQRYYDPQIGRMLSVDPVSVDSVGLNFNRYKYAANNPYRFTDPDGRFEKPTGSNISGGSGFSGSRVYGADLSDLKEALGNTIGKGVEEVGRAADAITSPEPSDLRDASLRVCAGVGYAGCLRLGLEDGRPAVEVHGGLGAARGRQAELVTDWTKKPGAPNEARGWAGVDFDAGVTILGVKTGYRATGLATTQGAYVDEGFKSPRFKLGSVASAIGNVIAGVRAGFVLPIQLIEPKTPADP